jgi:hypothetical protein
VSAGPLPSRIFAVHVAQVRELTAFLGLTGKAHGPDPEVSSAAAASVTRLLMIPGDEQIKQALMAAVAELHIHAGWAASDAGLCHRAMIHYARGLELATDAGDAYLQAHALTLAGFATVEHGHPDDGLKMLQLAQVKSGRSLQMTPGEWRCRHGRRLTRQPRMPRSETPGRRTGS